MEFIGWLLAFVITITIHEAAHAWMADRMGDPTARLMGRLSLNPIVHYDPIGTTLLLVLVFMRTFLNLPVIPFGWAKPVVFDPYNLKNPRRDSAIISLAGPGANIILAVILSVILKLSFSQWTMNSWIASFEFFLATLFVPIMTLNIVLAIFNLIPIHPLDGGKIFVGFLPKEQAEEAETFLSRYGMVILFFLIFPSFRGTSPLFLIMGPAVNFLINLLLPKFPLV